MSLLCIFLHILLCNHNLNTTIASAAPRDSSSPTNGPASTSEYRQKYFCLAFLSFPPFPLLYIIPPLFFRFSFAWSIPRLPLLLLTSLRFCNHHIQLWNFFSTFATVSLATAALYAREVGDIVVSTIPGTVKYVHNHLWDNSNWWRCSNHRGKCGLYYHYCCYFQA